VGVAKWTLADGKLKVDCDLEVTGKATAQKDITSITGNISATAGQIKGLTVDDAVNNLTGHTHAAPGSPAIPLAP